MVRKSGVTLLELLKLECMRHVKVAAGAGGLARIVTNVNVMEVPDIGDWINPGDLLLTTAYSIRNDYSALTGLVPTLAQKGLSGLVLKPKRYLNTIPEQMLIQANALNFPLLEMSPETAFSDILNPILSEILQMQTQYFQKTEEAHRLFMEVILKGGRLEDIADTLSRLIDNSVIITDSTDRILAKNLVAWNDEKFAHFYGVKHSLPGRLVDPLDSGMQYSSTLVQKDPVLQEFRIAISAKGQTRGYLCIWDNNRPLRQNDFIFADQAMTVAALELLNELSLSEIERRYRNEFLDALLSESPGNAQEFLERARYLGWDLSLDYVALIIDCELIPGPTRRKRQPQNQLQQTKETLFNFLVTQVLKPGERYIAGTKSDRIILLLAPTSGRKQDSVYIERRAGEILRALQQLSGTCQITLGVGRFYPEISGLRKSYAEALRALTIGKRLFGPGQVINFSQLGVYRILQAVTDWQELECFYRETVAPLDQHDADYHSDLVKTLEAYFACNCNLKQVAKALYIHYNTTLYRIERISEITGIDLKDPEARLNLLLGLKIRQILGQQKQPTH